MKTALLLMLTGALLGVGAASVIVPPLLGWYTSPGGLPAGAQVQAVVQIPEVIRYATSRLILYQSIGAGLGALLGLVMKLVFGAGRKASTPQAPPVAGPA
jgi:hypothetical protein